MHNRYFIIALVAVLAFSLIASSCVVTTYAKQSKADKKAEKSFDKKLDKAIDKKYSTIVNGTILLDGSKNVTIVMKTSTSSPPPVTSCPSGQHLENGVCVPNPPTPQPTVLNLTGKIVFGGDSDAGTSVGKNIANLINKAKPDFIYVLGDLTYGTGSFLYKFNNVKILQGNHDSASFWNSLKGTYAENKDYYIDAFSLGVNKTLWIYATNTEQQLTTAQVDFFKQNNVNLKHNDTVFIIGHKPSEMYTGHHTACEDNSCLVTKPIKQNIPSEIKVIQIYGHEHALAKQTDGDFFISGGLGRDLYSGSGAGWNVLVDNGFLTYDLKTDKFQFYDETGKAVLN